jgi:hypothetical protein
VHVEQVNQAKKAPASNNRLDDAGAQYWLNMDGWILEEVSYLLHGEDPRYQGGSVKIGKRRVLLPPSPPDDNLSAFVSRAFEAGVLVSPAAPKDVIAWAMEKKLRLPALLIPAEMAVKDESGAIKDYSVKSKIALEGVRMTSDLPTFNMPARPVDVPQWLRDLPPDSGVQYINNVGGQSRHGPVEVKGVIEIVEEVIKRQATEFFSLNEAAQVLADSRPNLKVLDMKDLMLRAYKDEKLPIRDPKHNGAVSGTRLISASFDLLSLQDINSWLTSEGMGYQFPQAMQPLVGNESGNTPSCAVPIQRAAAQNAAILEAIKNKGYQASSLPKRSPGKSGVKAEIKATVATNPLFQGTVFKKTWERLRSSGEIADAI